MCPFRVFRQRPLHLDGRAKGCCWPATPYRKHVPYLDKGVVGGRCNVARVGRPRHVRDALRGEPAATPRTCAWPSRDSSRLPSAAFQILMVLSPDEEASFFPSGLRRQRTPRLSRPHLNFTAEIALVCPRSVCVSAYWGRWRVST